MVYIRSQLKIKDILCFTLLSMRNQVVNFILNVRSNQKKYHDRGNIAASLIIYSFAFKLFKSYAFLVLHSFDLSFFYFEVLIID